MCDVLFEELPPTLLLQKHREQAVQWFALLPHCNKVLAVTRAVVVLSHSQRLRSLVVVPVTDWWPEEASCFLFKHLNLTPRACTYTHSHTYMCRHLLVFSILFQELLAAMTYLTMLSVTIVMRHQQRRWGGKHSSTPPNRDLSLAVRAQHMDQTATILTKTLCFIHINMAQLTQMYFLLKGCM